MIRHHHVADADCGVGYDLMNLHHVYLINQFFSHDLNLFIGVEKINEKYPLEFIQKKFLNKIIGQRISMVTKLKQKKKNTLREFI